MDHSAWLRDSLSVLVDPKNLSGKSTPNLSFFLV
uniref:Uncharacterized protein n=1 Tax=Arundo donax TaxID=35708 RepID=A0A0A8Y4M4_ARUDO